jgi:hypothetical protein
MDISIVGNFDTYARTADPVFTKTGTWYDYFSGDSIMVSDVHMPLELAPSEYHIYTTQRLDTPDLISAPKALDVSISGTAGIGEEITGQYTYFDANGDPEGESLYRWFKGTEPDGSDRMQILGAMGRTYTIKEVDWNHYIFFQVTPVAASGGLLTGLTQSGVLDLAVSVPGMDVPGMELTVYPNPTPDGFYVRIGDIREKTFRLELYRADGQQIPLRETVLNPGSTNEVYIPMEGMDSGVYILKVSSGTEVVLRRIMKL